MAESVNILLLEDSLHDARMLDRHLRQHLADPQITRVGDLAAFRTALSQGQWDVVLSDFDLPGFDAFDALEVFKAHGADSDLPFILVSRRIGEETAVMAMRCGAADYIMKDNLSRLVPAVEREIRDARFRRERTQAQQELLESETRFKAMTAHVPGMVFQLTVDPWGTPRFTYVSDGALSLLNVAPGRLASDWRHFDTMVGGPWHRAFYRTLHTSAYTMQSWEWEGRIDAADGHSRFVHLRARPRVDEGGVLVWDGILLDITSRKQAEEEIRHSREQLRRLTEHLERVREDERARIAREVHDELGQGLTVLKLELAWMRKQWAAEPQMDARFQDVLGGVDATIDKVRRITAELRPAIIDELGLPAAIESQLKDRLRPTSIAYHYECSNDELELDAQQAITVFRVFQELLTNVIRHSGARQVNVRLSMAKRLLRLVVEDDGVGIKPGQVADDGSFGIIGMVERLNMLGGHLGFATPPEGGTRAKVELPVNSIAVRGAVGC